MRVVPFRRLWYTTALSSLGDWLGLLATTAMATTLANGYQAKNYALGGVLIVRLLPAMVLGPLAGAFADRFDRRYTMVITDLLRFVLFLSIPLAHLVVDNNQTLGWLLISTFLIECISLFWAPAKDASVPNLVRRDQIESANQLSLITTYGITPVLGAGLFSVLSVITSGLAKQFDFFEAQPVNLALYFNAGTFLFGAIIVLFIPEISGHRAALRAGIEAGEQPSAILKLIREGLSFIKSSRLIGGLIVGLIGAFVAAGAVIGAGKIFVTSLGGGDAAYGVVFGAVFVGLGAGMAFGPRIARELSRRRLFGLSIVFAAASLIVTAVVPVLWLAVVMVVGIGFGGGVAYLSANTLLGTDVEDAMRGRVFALLQSLIRVVLILGLAAVPFVVAQVGRRTLRVFGGEYVVDGTRIVLFAGGVLALLAGIMAYRKMDEREKLGFWHDIKMSVQGRKDAHRRLQLGGLFVAFEGGEGSGKSTQINLLAEALRAQGRAVVVTHEPGATEVGQQIRQLLLHHDEPLTDRAEALLFAADRAHHVDTVIRPALEAGAIVLTDRFVDSSLAYQGIGRGLSVDEVRKVSRWATDGLVPDLTILLDLPASVGLARARGRGAADKLESESTGFHEKVRAAFRYLSESDPKRYVVLDATAPAEQISAAVLTSVEKVAKNVPTPLASDPTASQPTEPRSETDRETVP
jgi:dTMP kinase